MPRDAGPYIYIHIIYVVYFFTAFPHYFHGLNKTVISASDQTSEMVRDSGQKDKDPIKEIDKHLVHIKYHDNF